MTEHVRRRNQLIKPYTSPDDERFAWLKDVFLQYLEKSRQLEYHETRFDPEGNYSADDRGKMFLSNQTYKGLKISIYSHVLRPFSFYLLKGFNMY